jgi:hypothetical protein
MGDGVIGALLITALKNILNLLNIQSFYQQVATGLVIILAIIMDCFRVKQRPNFLLIQKAEYHRLARGVSTLNTKGE